MKYLVLMHNDMHNNISYSGICGCRKSKKRKKNPNQKNLIQK
jgi:hypothetical protein